MTAEPASAVLAPALVAARRAGIAVVVTLVGAAGDRVRCRGAPEQRDGCGACGRADRHGREPHVTAEPASAVLAPGLVAARRAGIAVVVTLVGAAGDPQGLDRQAGALIASGAAVHRSNAMAAERAAELIAAVGSPT